MSASDEQSRYNIIAYCLPAYNVHLNKARELIENENTYSSGHYLTICVEFALSLLNVYLFFIKYRVFLVYLGITLNMLFCLEHTNGIF